MRTEMSSKLFVLLLIVSSLFFVSCSSGQSPESQDWPDDDDIATMIALTLTQRAEDGSQSMDLDTDIQGEADPTLEYNFGDILSEESTVDENGDDEPSGTPEEEVEDVQGEDAIEPSASATSTEESTIDVSLTPTPTQVRVTEENEQPQDPAGIPGFLATELVERLSGFGFDCPVPDDPVDGVYTRQCAFATEDYQYVVTFWGRAANSIDLIETTAFYFGSLDYTDLTAVIFEIIAEILYNGADPQQAKEWINDTVDEIQLIGDEAFDEFGGVRYYIYAIPSAQVLEIGSR